MSRYQIKELVSILMESPFYWTIPIEKRFLLVKGLIKTYRVLIKGKKPVQSPERVCT